MHSESHEREITCYRSVRTLEGKVESVQFIRRNGRLVPRFTPEWTEPSPHAADTADLQELVEEITQNLTATESRTFLKLLDGRSILDIACEDGVSRAAVYERIRGKSRRTGGMVAKNDYVAIWWKRRHEAKESPHGC